MMQFIRDHSNSLWAKILLVGVGVSLAGIGGTQIFSGPSADTVATVNGAKVSLQEVEAQYQQLLNANAQNGDVTEEIQRQYRLIARQDLIQRRAMDSQIKEWKIRASDRSVAEEIVSIPSFQKDGVFDQETYKTALFYSGYSIEGFEDAIRRDVEERIVREAFVNSAFVSNNELQEQIAFLGQKRDLEVATFNYLDDLESVAVSENEIKKQYEENIAQYKTPNLVKLQYVELEANALKAEDQSYSAAEIQEEADKLKKQDEQRLSEQFTIEYSTDSEKQEAMDILADLKERIESGAMTFDEAKAEIAQIDNAYYNRNGNFKYGAAGIPEFDDALFELTEEAPFSTPFSTGGEVHLVHLLNISTPYNDDAALLAAAEKSLKENAVADLYMTKEARMQELAETYTESLGEIAQDLGLELKETDWLNLDSQEDLLGNASVWAAVSGYDVMENGRNSLPFAFNDQTNHAMIVRIADKEESRSKSLEESYEEIKAELAKNRAKEETMNRVNAMLEAGDTQNFQNDIEQLGFSYNQYNDLAITSVGQLQTKPVEQYAISNGFQKIHHLEDGKPQYLVEDVDGYIFVVAVNKINVGEAEGFTDEDRAQLQEYLDGREASFEYQALMQYLFNNSKIKLYNNSFFQ
ncbi:SurA N-terminal domain-containing protein [Ignatzschineria rhizosphaerae]|uniref:SurA N-terminal domain-containing protein n=1 Tax=Ignatzschineria rhizosphaerae TaxID=2923279 RepID=A0ABY3X1D1_9GAMM|nr:peptidylprolyl isomerase [Ignatzschineria rhizosphaerae]UNM96684.1 SurA N-terminal domain-containing protein [Ignatzschineria rhizosphaerae]